MLNSHSMLSLYNRVAGQSVERLAALSDGIFAVTMTLLVLDLRVPTAGAIHSERDLWHLLLALAPRLLIFLMSVMTLGIFWIGQQTQLNHFAGPTASSPRFTSPSSAPWLWCRSPLHSSPNSSDIVPRSWLIGSTSSCSALALYWSWSYATRNHHHQDGVPSGVHRAVVRRIAIAQTLYAGGASLCFINTYCSIAAIVLVQVNYAMAPRFC